MQTTSRCSSRTLPLFSIRRIDIETFARGLEAKGRARATVTRRLSTIAGLYRYAVEEELLDHSPAAHVRRPRLDYESHATALDSNEVGALLVAAGLGPAPEHALMSLLALNGLRISKPLPPCGSAFCGYNRPSAGRRATWPVKAASRSAGHIRLGPQLSDLSFRVLVIWR
jgi:Phage integrase, N-terminal SAM-like domain